VAGQLRRARAVKTRLGFEKQAATAASSPPYAAPGQLLVGGEVATARNGCGGARVLAAARARAKGGG
jgi:hypothetical protein